ncbi:hypothetical protein NECAME_15978, partial [Necator americanus]
AAKKEGLIIQHEYAVDYISAPFIRRNGELFLNYDNEKLFFSSAQREMLTHEEEPYFRKMKENSFVTYVELMQEIERDPRKKLSDLWSSVRTNPATFGNCTVINYVGQTEIVPCGLRNNYEEKYQFERGW